MIKFLKLLAFIFSWIVPFTVVYVNHVVLTEAKISVDMFGLLIVLALLIGLVRKIDKKIELWEIHKEHKVFIINWKNSKKVMLMSILTWVLFTIDDNLGKMRVTALLIMFSFVIGWFLSVIANVKQNKKVTQNE